MTLKEKTYSAVRWTTIAAVARSMMQMAQVAILARLLAPEDYGLMAMVGVVLSFTYLFADLGLNSAYMQKQDVTPQQRSSLFWLNIIMSVGLMLIVSAISPLLAWLFRDERLTPLLQLSVITFIINSLGQQVRITAEKMLSFRPVVLLEITAALVAFATAVIAAKLGLGVYSLVLASIVAALTGTGLAWIFVAQGWRPHLRFSLDDVRPFLRFGGALVGNGIANQINLSIDLLLGGRMLAASQLGLYSVPRNLVLQLQFMVNPIITRVGFPLIAQVQNDIPRVRSIYIKTLNMTASTNAPLYIGIAFFATEIVHLLLGSKWHGSIDCLRVLSIWGFLRSTGNPAGSLLLGMGRADLAFKWNLSLLFIVPPILWSGSQYGTKGLAWALLTFSALIFIPIWFVLVEPLCKVQLFEYTIAAFKPMIIAFVSIGPAYWLVTEVNSIIIRLILGILLSTVLYLTISYKCNREWFLAMCELMYISKKY